MLFFVQLKANLVGFFSTVRRASTDLVTMATASGNLFLYSSKGITSKFRKFLSWYQNVSVRLLTLPVRRGLG